MDINLDAVLAAEKDYQDYRIEYIRAIARNSDSPADLVTFGEKAGLANRLRLKWEEKQVNKK